MKFNRETIGTIGIITAISVVGIAGLALAAILGAGALSSLASGALGTAALNYIGAGAALAVGGCLTSAIVGMGIAIAIDARKGKKNNNDAMHINDVGRYSLSSLGQRGDLNRHFEKVSPKAIFFDAPEDNISYRGRRNDGFDY